MQTSPVSSQLNQALSPSSNKISDMITRLLAQINLSQQFIKGCSPAEIAEVEKQVEAPLPTEYRNFLQLMGKGAGKLFQGTAIYYPNCLDFQADAKNLLAINDFLPLPHKTFVFSIHQGYEVNFFHLDQGSDPAVYQYSEGQEEQNFIKISDSFSGFIKDSIEFHLQVWPNLNP